MLKAEFNGNNANLGDANHSVIFITAIFTNRIGKVRNGKSKENTARKSEIVTKGIKTIVAGMEKSET